jgi:hypothetical protein
MIEKIHVERGDSIQKGQSSLSATRGWEAVNTEFARFGAEMQSLDPTGARS